jgi:hypothetical protein
MWLYTENDLAPSFLVESKKGDFLTLAPNGMVAALLFCDMVFPYFGVTINTEALLIVADYLNAL